MPYDSRDRFFYRAPATVGKHDIIELLFGFKPDDDAPPERQSAEMGITWSRIGGGVAARLQIFDDQWHALAAMPDLITLLAELGAAMPEVDSFSRREPPTIDEVCARLEALGFRDLTPQPRDFPVDEIAEAIVDCMNDRSEVSFADIVASGVSIELKNGKRLAISITEED